MLPGLGKSSQRSKGTRDRDMGKFATRILATQHAGFIHIIDEHGDQLERAFRR